MDLAFTPAECDAFILSLDVAGWSVLLNVPIALILALALSRGRFAGRGVIEGAIHLPLVLPPVVVGFVLLLLFGHNGAIGRWLYDLDDPRPGARLPEIREQGDRLARSLDRTSPEVFAERDPARRRAAIERTGSAPVALGMAST